MLQSGGVSEQGGLPTWELLLSSPCLTRLLLAQQLHKQTQLGVSNKSLVKLHREQHTAQHTCKPIVAQLIDLLEATHVRCKSSVVSMCVYRYTASAICNKQTCQEPLHRNFRDNDTIWQHGGVSTDSSASNEIYFPQSCVSLEEKQLSNYRDT